MVVAGVGCATAIFAASIGLVQNDIKKVLAYSTVSQLGYMFLGVGVGAYAAGIFHLYTHAFFKGLLFLGSGSVIHALSGEQDIRKMGQIFGKIPQTYRTFLIGCLAIAGIPGLAGFFSKDEVLWMAFTASEGPGHFPYLFSKVLWFVGVCAALMTAFYMFRLLYLVFFNSDRVGHEAAHHLHESPKVMTVPLWILAIGSIVAGYVGLPKVFLGGKESAWGHWLHATLYQAHGAAAAHEPSAALEWTAMGVSVLVALAGIALAYTWYKRETGAPSRLAKALAFPYRVVLNKYFVDEIYFGAFIRPFVKLCDGFAWWDKWIVDGLVNGARHLTVGASHASFAMDKYVVDGAGVNGTAATFQMLSRFNRRMVTGQFQHYALGVVVGLVVLLVWYVAR
jgi:NADH-quinone oxidoreductase subunit L